VTHQLLVYVDDVNVIPEIIKGMTEGLLNAINEVGPQVNTEN
jgi:hypothetical protein